MIHVLWGLLWRLLVSALIAVIVLLVLLLLTACAKPAPVNVITDASMSLSNVQDEGYLRSQPARAWPKPRAARLATIGQSLGDSEDIPWRGLIVLPDLSVVTVDLRFAAEQASVSLQESSWRCDAYATVVVDGVTYEVLGLYQLLWDSAIQKRAFSLGYARADMLRCKPNAVVAFSWWSDTEDWRRWATKPQYRTDKSVSGEW